MTSARFIYDYPEKSADLYYATKFLAPDAVIFFEHKDKKYLVLSDLEIDRARKTAEVDKVLSLSKYAKDTGKENPTPVDILHKLFSEQGIKNLIVPANMSFDLVDRLRRLGYKFEVGPTPFYPERFSKTKEERKIIEKTQRIVFQAIALAEKVLAKSRIKKDRLIYQGRLLTSEGLRQMITIFLLEHDCMGTDSIVACGQHALDPHDVGSGFLRPHQSIIVDIFPRSLKNLYYADATRTFCKGQASEALYKLYATVKDAQEMAISKVRSGINGHSVHEAVHAFFAKKGYKTGEKGGRRQGFIHQTGHSIGLELHEEPGRFGPRDFAVKEGYIMSVEPGLYYAGIGGVRIEDLVYVTKSGCEVLASYPKRLEIR